MRPRTVQSFPLQRGGHPDPGSGMCAMEMVAWLAGEAHSDEPACACPVLAAVVRCLNDAVGDAEREGLLRPLLPLLVHTRGGADLEAARAWLVADRVARAFAPATLRDRGVASDAESALRALPPLRAAAGAARALAHLQHPQVRAARWVVQRAADAHLAPRLWVAGVVWAARDLGGAKAFAAVAHLVRAMAQVARITPAGGRAAAARSRNGNLGSRQARANAR
jgi:hypothetical protein